MPRFLKKVTEGSFQESGHDLRCVFPKRVLLWHAVLMNIHQEPQEPMDWKAVLWAVFRPPTWSDFKALGRLIFKPDPLLRHLFGTKPEGVGGWVNRLRDLAIYVSVLMLGVIGMLWLGWRPIGYSLGQ